MRISLKKNGIKNNVYLTIPAFLRVFFYTQSYYSPCANKQTTPGLEDKTQRGNNVVNPTLLS